MIPLYEVESCSSFSPCICPSRKYLTTPGPRLLPATVKASPKQRSGGFSRICIEMGTCSSCYSPLSVNLPQIPSGFIAFCFHPVLLCIMLSTASAIIFSRTFTCIDTGVAELKQICGHVRLDIRISFQGDHSLSSLCTHYNNRSLIIL